MDGNYCDDALTTVTTTIVKTSDSRLISAVIPPYDSVHTVNPPMAARLRMESPSWLSRAATGGIAMLTFVPTAYDNYRMSKQPISVTLSPDNLLWLKGRARAVAAGSLSEFLDRLITRARCGQDTPRPFRSMKGALAAAGSDVDVDVLAVPTEIWQAWREEWDQLLVEFDGASQVEPVASSAAGRSRRSTAVADKAPAYGRRRSGRG